MNAEKLQERLTRRFHSKYAPEPSTGCWLWTDCLDRHGYGRLQLGKSKTLKAHRVAYEMHKGPIPEGLMVLHICDVRCCVNPAHLYAGTPKDNSRDCIQRGRYVSGGKPHPGEKNGRAKVTAADVQRIRKRAEVECHKDIAPDYGLHTSAIQRIASRKTWRHIQ